MSFHFVYIIITFLTINLTVIDDIKGCISMSGKEF